MQANQPLQCEAYPGLDVLDLDARGRGPNEATHAHRSDGTGYFRCPQPLRCKGGACTANLMPGETCPACGRGNNDDQASAPHPDGARVVLAIPASKDPDAFFDEVNDALNHHEIESYATLQPPEITRRERVSDYLLQALERLTHPMASDDDLDFAKTVVRMARGSSDKDAPATPSSRPDLFFTLVSVENVREAVRNKRDAEKDEDARDYLSVALAHLEDAHHAMQEAGA